MKIKFKIAVVSDVGLVRKNNEDNYFIPNIGFKQMQDGCSVGYTEFSASKAYMCICDGMGGHNSGEVASYMAVKDTEKNYYKLIGDEVKNAKQMNELIDSFIVFSNDKIYNRAEQEPALKSMGTTMTGLYFINGRAYFVNVGDSRSYVLKNHKLIQLSIDHSDPQIKNAITRFLGMSTEYGQIEADIAYIPSKINAHRRYILCSDGLTDMLDDESITGILLKYKDAKLAAQELVNAAKKNGGRDNITVAVIDAAPANPVVKCAMNKVLSGCVAAVLLAGAAFGAACLLKPKNENGISIAELNKDIEATNDLSEANNVVKENISGIKTELENYRNYAAGISAGDAAVEECRKELTAAVDNLESKLLTYQKKVDEINGSSSEKEEKLAMLKALANDSVGTELKAAADMCSQKKNALSVAAEKYAKQKEKEEQHSNKSNKTNKPTPKPSGKPNVKPTATSNVKPTATPNAKPTATPNAKPTDKSIKTPTVNTEKKVNPAHPTPTYKTPDEREQ